MAGVTLRPVPTKDLVENPRNIREHLDGIDELAASIRANGLLQPLIVNEVRGRLVVTDGHRRLAAARLAGVPVLMCLVTTGADASRVTMTMLASAMHKELRPIEQARAFERLQRQGVTTSDIARATGYSMALIRARLLLLELPQDAQDMVEDASLSIGQAVSLAKQVRAKRSGSTATSTSKTKHFSASHPLAREVKASCTHGETRARYGGFGCGVCWENAIRADERARAEVVA